MVGAAEEPVRIFPASQQRLGLAFWKRPSPRPWATALFSGSFEGKVRHTFNKLLFGRSALQPFLETIDGLLAREFLLGGLKASFGRSNTASAHA
jgi:hypothetical protein